MTVYHQFNTLLANPASSTFGGVYAPDWTAQAACVHESPALFFPRKGKASAAKAVCHSCPVIAECLDFALAHENTGTVFGVYGGLSAKERRRLLEPLPERTCMLPGCDLPVLGAGNARYCSREHTVRMKYLRAAGRRTAS